MYTQGLHRREFEVGYTHRRERALQEGEGASIELARQMEAQVLVAIGDCALPGDVMCSASRVSSVKNMTYFCVFFLLYSVGISRASRGVCYSGRFFECFRPAAGFTVKEGRVFPT